MRIAISYLHRLKGSSIFRPTLWDGKKMLIINSNFEQTTSYFNILSVQHKTLHGQAVYYLFPLWINPLDSVSPVHTEAQLLPAISVVRICRLLGLPGHFLFIAL